jgi:hypothetical protein
VVIKGNILTVAGKIATGAEGCVGAEGYQRLWVSGDDSLTFRSE